MKPNKNTNKPVIIVKDKESGTKVYCASVSIAKQIEEYIENYYKQL